MSSNPAQEFRDSIRPVPYRWYPHDTTPRTPAVGDHVGLYHAVWEVMEIRPYEPWDISDEDRDYYPAEYLERHPPFHVILAHVRDGVASDDRNHWVSITRGSIRQRGNTNMHVYKHPGHAPVCSRCGDASPCREVMAVEMMEAGVERATHYENPDLCPACDKPFRGRAKRGHTFETNLYVPLGPPVTYHVRCTPSAQDYERKLAAATPGYVMVLNCDGHVTAHSSRSYSCTAGDTCPGGGAWHQSWSMCRCPEHHGQHERGCHVDQDATRV